MQVIWIADVHNLINVEEWKKSVKYDKNYCTGTCKQYINVASYTSNNGNIVHVFYQYGVSPHHYTANMKNKLIHITLGQSLKHAE